MMRLSLLVDWGTDGRSMHPWPYFGQFESHPRSFSISSMRPTGNAVASTRKAATTLWKPGSRFTLRTRSITLTRFGERAAQLRTSPARSAKLVPHIHALEQRKLVWSCCLHLREAVV